MGTYIIILNLIVLFGIIFLAYRIVKLTNEKEKLEKHLEEKKAEAKAWKTLLKKYIDERK